MKRISTESTTESNNDNERMALIKKQNKKLSELYNIIEGQEETINQLKEEKTDFNENLKIYYLIDE